MCTVLLPPGVNPTAVNKYININTKSDTVILTEEFAVDLGSFLFLRLGKPIVLRFVTSDRCFIACQTVQLFSVMFNMVSDVHNFDLHTKHLTSD